MEDNKIAPPWIKTLGRTEIFVFGSNEAGVHGAGAASTARIKWGAKHGKGFGIEGRTFAIPTKDWTIEVLPIPVIAHYVDSFIRFAKIRPEFTFLLTEIGCGLSGYTPKEIAPLFEDSMELENVKLPMSFYEELKS